MRIIPYHDRLLDECAALWWRIYAQMPYVHRPDGHQTINTPPIGPGYFGQTLQDGLAGAPYWLGDGISEESVYLAQDGTGLVGILVCSVDELKSTAHLLSAYVERDHRGHEAAHALLSAALAQFKGQGLQHAVAAPGRSRSLEVESPIHLALLDAGFAWEGDWQPSYPREDYGVFLGGSLEGFRIGPEIEARMAELGREGVRIERCERGQFPSLRRLDTGAIVDTIDDNSDCAYVAFVDGLAVGWTFEIHVFEDQGRIVSMVGPEVIPAYRRRGIGKVLHHLGTAEAVRRGAHYGWTATEIHNPARIIYRSVGFRYWYTSFGRMSRRLGP